MNLLYRHLCACALVLVLGQASAEPQQGRAGQVRPDAAPAEQSKRNDDGRAPPPQDNPRRPPKLSPEERKELRQQIHEAGHDLYHPKRHPPQP